MDSLPTQCLVVLALMCQVITEIIKVVVTQDDCRVVKQLVLPIRATVLKTTATKCLVLLADTRQQMLLTESVIQPQELWSARILFRALQQVK